MIENPYKLVRFLILFLILAAQGWGATYYVSPTGSNTAPYDTWAKASTSVQTCISAIAALGDGGGHTVMIGPGTYNGFISITDADHANLSIIGDSPDTTIIRSSGDYHTVYADTPDGVTISNLALEPTGAKAAIFLASGVDGWTFSNIVARSASGHNAGMVTIGGTESLAMTRVRVIHNTPDAADRAVIKLSGDTSGDLGYIELVFPAAITRYGIQLAGTGAVNINNSILGGGFYAVLQTGAGTTNVRNSILFGPVLQPATATLTKSAGILNASTSLIYGNTASSAAYAGAGVALDAFTTTNANSDARVRLPGRKAYIVPCVDDAGNFAYAGQLEAYLASKGAHGTYFFELANWNAANNVALREMLTRGTMEIGAHSYSHSDLAVADGLKIWGLSAAVTIDQASDKITTPGGEVSGIKAKTLAAIKAELEAPPHSITVTPVAAAYESNAAGAIDALALGEVLKSSVASADVTISVIDHTEGLFKAEVADVKSSMAAILNGGGDIVDPQTGLKYATNSFGNPYNTRSDLATAAILGAGYLSGRSYGYQVLGSLNLFAMHTLGSGLLGASAGETKAKVRAVLANATYYGQAVFILSHSAGEIPISGNGWEAIFNAIEEFGGDVDVVSAQEFSAIATASPWTYNVGTGISSRSYADASDFHLLPTSPAINAGVDVGLTTDIEGKAIRGLPDIGAYEWQGRESFYPFELREYELEEVGPRPYGWLWFDLESILWSYLYE